MEEEYLTVAEVAALLKLNEQTVRNWIDSGRLSALRVGRRVRIKRSDLDAMLAAGATVPPAPDIAARGRLTSASMAIADATRAEDDEVLAAALTELSAAALMLAEALRA
jgi:excisionase family DNA binding protein